jgi:hypothetical protein
MICLITLTKLSCPEFEFSLKVKVMGLNPGYLFKSFLLYILAQLVEIIFLKILNEEPTLKVSAINSFQTFKILVSYW